MDDQQPPQRKWFRKTRERIAEFEKTHDNFRAVVEHVDEHKEAYLAGAGCLVVGFVGGKRFQRPIEVLVKPVFNNTVAPVMNNIGNQLTSTVSNAGHMHKIIKRIKPDGSYEIFETVNDAAREVASEYGLKVSSALDRVSKCANGHIPDYRGEQFVFLGTGTR
jgi:hypothetical protein